MSAERRTSPRRIHDIPEEAVPLGTYGGKTYSYHNQAFIDHDTGMHHKVVLSRDQHRLFSALLAHRGQYLRPETLFRAYLEDLPADYRTDPIEVESALHPAISRLRKLLKKIDPTLGESLTTKRLVGYRFGPDGE